jgi:hypothetical protein
MQSSGPNQQSLKWLSGLVKSVGLTDFLVTQGDRRFFDYFIVVDADVRIFLGNRARVALGFSLEAPARANPRGGYGRHF